MNEAPAASDATSEVASELQLDEQACPELGELSYPLSEIRKEVCNWEKVATGVHEPHTKVINIRVLSRA